MRLQAKKEKKKRVKKGLDEFWQSGPKSSNAVPCSPSKVCKSKRKKTGRKGRGREKHEVLVVC